MRILLLILIFSYSLSAQSIRINEAVSSNSIYFDEDGDSPDWFELYNNGTQDISLENWTISDDLEELDMWTFPAITISPDEYLLVWASGKNRSLNTYSRTLINQGDIFKFDIPNTEPNPNWKNLNFNVSSWANGATGFGYSDGDDNTTIPYGTLSVYLRKNFNITNVDDIISLILDIDYDDAFVAYINGVEVTRANIGGVPPPFDSADISTDHEAQMYSGGLPDRFVLSNLNSFLVEGENVLAIQAHNISSTSSDFTIIPFLSAIYSTPNDSGIDPPGILNLSDDNPLHTNFKISSNSETLILSNNIGTIVDELVIEGLPPNTSIGVSNITENIVSYIQTTPGYENADEEFLGSIQNEVIFSQNGGITQNPFSLSLSGNTPSQNIRFTTNGSTPTNSSNVYIEPITISENSSVRARIFSNTNNYLPSKVTTESYIFNSSHDIDIMLLTVNPEDFFDDETGIYVFGPDGTFDTWQPYFGANFWEDWERPIHFSFYKNNSNEFVEFDGGVKIFGGWSRGQNGQRSLAFFARGQYGDSKFEHPFFDNLNYDKFEAFVLRSSGQDWMRSNMKDIMLTSLMRGSEIDFQEHNPVATYINGEYWGMYNMREKTNEHMLASKHGVDADRITLLTNNAEIIEGDNTEYNELINYIENIDYLTDDNYEYLSERIDIKQYALYQATNIFINNTDWPGNNIKFWKHPDTKWRWIMYDTDFGFGPWWNWGNFEENTLNFALEPNGGGWPNPPWSTLLFRKLITNINFRDQFINRYADELNTRFLSSNVVQHINQVFGTIQPEINAHFERWKDDPSLGYEITDVNGHIGFYQWAMMNFATQRPAIVKEHIKSQFDLPNFHPLTITNIDSSQGLVEINENLNIQESSWTGDYFETVPVKLKAIAELGYEFSHWSGDLYSTNQTINVSIDQAFEIIPNFTNLSTPLVINEINYRSSDTFNPDDWIEIYNPKAEPIDISNWELRDENDANVFIIPDGTQIQGNGFLVFVKDESDFISMFPNIPFIGELGYGLGRADRVRLYNSGGDIIDDVSYDSESPWPSCADETGNTLELIEPNLENSLPENWDCINENGSPNAVNSEQLFVEDNELSLIKLYPNPVNSTLFVRGIEVDYNIDVYTLLGQLVLSINNSNEIDMSLFKQGVYMIKIWNKNTSTVKRILKF
tara:strand:- start:16593 stop:20087 length:3495 start_codon:yes stop_codon:yes gene_type:complete